MRAGPKSRTAVVAVAAAALALAATGCTVLGLAGGIGYDAQHGRVAPARFGRIANDTRATAWLRDGSFVRGRWAGLDSTRSGESSHVAVLLRRGGELTRVPRDSVRFVMTPYARGKVAGLLVGAGIDALALWWLASASTAELLR